MALFKPMIGADKTALDAKTKVEGYVWFTTGDGKFYIDWKDGSTLKRSVLNAGHADTASKDQNGNIISSTYFKLSGGTITGSPVIANASYYGSIWFKPTKITSGGENRNATIYAWTGSSDATDLSYTRFSFRQYSANANATTMSSVHEEFYLPKTEQGLSSGGSYNILTSKNAVKISEGGTGAEDAPTARTNLNVPSRTGSGASGDWNINAATATALTTSAGSASNPIYFSDGKPVKVNNVWIGSATETASRTFDIKRKNSSDASYGRLNIGVSSTGGTAYIEYLHYDTSGTEDHDNLLYISGNSFYPNASTINLGTSTKKWQIVYATTFSGDLDGNADTATALTTSAGSSSKPVYFSSGKPAAISSVALGDSTSATGRTFSVTRKDPDDASYGYLSLGVGSSAAAVYLKYAHYDTSGTMDIERFVWLTDNTFYPGTTDTLSLGALSYKWKTVYATSFNGSGADLTSLNASNISTGTLSAARLATSGATAGTYGPSAAVTGSNNTTMNVPEITVDKYGRVTSITNRVYTAKNTTYSKMGAATADAAGTMGLVPAPAAGKQSSFLRGDGTWATPTDTNNKVAQSRSTASGWRAVLSHYTHGDYNVDPGSATNAVYYNENVAVQYSTGSLKATAVYGAVWNDYAEYRITDVNIEAGRVVIEHGDDTLTLATERLMPGANIVSDTFGFAIGETDKAQTPLAVSGRALAYPYEDRNSYCPGDPVCSGPNGTVSKMTREEVMMYPDRMIGTVSAIPTYETWGTGNVAVNGRIWIKVV